MINKFGDVMYNMVTIVNSTILYIWEVAERVDFKNSPIQKIITM